MKKFLSILVTLVTLVMCLALLTACGQKTNNNDVSLELDNQTQKSKLKVALDASYRPMEWMENGKIEGFDADLIRELAKDMEREVELYDVQWDELFDKLYSGEYDVAISSISITDERKNSMLFSEPYYNSSPLILTNKSTNIKSAKDLSKKSVAVQDATIHQEKLSNNIAGIKLKKFTSADDALNSFAKGEVDAVVADGPVAMDFAKQKNNSNYTIIEDKEFFDEDNFGIAVNKGNEQLLSEINTSLNNLKNSKKIDELYLKYFTFMPTNN